MSRKKLLYQSLIVSVLLYGSPVFSPTLEYLRKLESYQRKFLNWVCTADDYNRVLIKLGLLPICFQLILNDLLFLWKIWNKRVDIAHELQLKVFPKTLRNSANNLFAVPPSKKFKSDGNYFIRATVSANELLKLNVISFQMSYSQFKRSLKMYLMDRITAFDINLTCTYFMKCHCPSCRCWFLVHIYFYQPWSVVMCTYIFVLPLSGI